MKHLKQKANQALHPTVTRAEKTRHGFRRVGLNVRQKKAAKRTAILRKQVSRGWFQYREEMRFKAAAENRFGGEFYV